MSKPKVIVTRRWPQAVEDALAARFDTTFNRNDQPMSAAELRAALATADAVCPTVTDSLSADILGQPAAASTIRARLIANFGVGFNHIDIAAAKARGLTITNTPEVLTDCTADLAMTLLLMVARRAGEGEREVRSGNWSGWRPTHLMGTKVTGKTLGLVGFGRIAQAMAHKAHFGFGMHIVFNDPQLPKPAAAQALQAESLPSIEDVFARADFVSLHCPGGSATHHLVNATRLGLMQPGAFLINTARGDVVDTTALIAALTAGHIAGAGLDVYEGEPAVPQALKSLENVVLLPHLGSASTETRVAMGMRVIENLEAFFAGREPRDRIG